MKPVIQGVEVTKDHIGKEVIFRYGHSELLCIISSIDKKDFYDDIKRRGKEARKFNDISQRSIGVIYIEKTFDIIEIDTKERYWPITNCLEWSYNDLATETNLNDKSYTYI